MEKDFKMLGISDELIEKLRLTGIKEPTPIQEIAIPEVFNGRHILAQAQTGTGKTLAFALPIVQKTDPKKEYIQAVIVTPTRELALQITEVFQGLTKDTGINILSVYGGQDTISQAKKLKGNVHIVIGTPGRLLDQLNQKNLDVTKAKRIVIDEADVMLKMGFIEDIEKVIKTASPSRQLMMFSATIPKGIRMMSRKYMKNPADLCAQTRTISVESITQVAFETTEEEKIPMLLDLMKAYNPFMSIVFCSSKKRVSEVADALFSAGYMVDEIHGDITQVKRERIMQSFRDLKLQILVATDIAARGLDIQGVTHVFNFDVPHSTEWYIHRIGRTGRAGEEGVAVTLFTQKDAYYLSQIEKGISKAISKKLLKNGEIVDVVKKMRSFAEARKGGTQQRRNGGGYRNNEEAPGWKTMRQSRAKLTGKSKRGR